MKIEPEAEAILGKYEGQNIFVVRWLPLWWKDLNYSSCRESFGMPIQAIMLINSFERLADIEYKTDKILQPILVVSFAALILNRNKQDISICLGHREPNTILLLGTI